MLNSFVGAFFVYGFLALLACVLFIPKETVRVRQLLLRALQGHRRVEKETNEKLEALMRNILFGFRHSRFFNHPNAASIFVVYSHDPDTTDDLGDAESATVRKIIRCLGEIRSYTRSDRGPVLHARDQGNNAPLHEILENQFCLLPRGCFEKSSHRPVEKVVLCYSERLNAYCSKDEAKEYMFKLEEAYHQALGTPQTFDIDTRGGPKIQVQNAMRRMVERCGRSENTWFHHVLTEIAFLCLRTAEDKDPWTIVPVVLNDTEIDGYLKRAIHSTQVHLVKKDGSTAEMHRLFFKLLHRIYEELPQQIKQLEACYYTGVKYLESDDLLTEIEFSSYVREQVEQELDRCFDAGPIDVRRSLHQVLETAPRPAPAKPPKAPVIVPPLLVDPAILTRPSVRQRQIVEYLFNSPMANDQHRTQTYILDRKHPGSLEWVKKHPAYVLWTHHDSTRYAIEQDSTTSILGIRGKPGSGKSTLLSSLVVDVQSEPKQTHLVVFFFFNNRRALWEVSMEVMYCSLISQLLLQMPDAGQELWAWMEKSKVNGSHASSTPDVQMRDIWGDRPADALREWFIIVLSKACGKWRVRIFLDALDEAGDEVTRDVVADIRRIHREVRKVSTGLSICYSCRYFPAVVVDNGVEIRVDDCNRDDIFAYTVAELRNGCPWTSRLAKGKLEDIATGICDRSEGIFIYAVLIVEEVKYATTERMALNICQDLFPRGLDELYFNIFSNIPSGLLLSAKIILRWIAFSFRPMSVTELRHACAVDEFFMHDKAKSLEESAGFVETDEEMFVLIQDCVGALVQVAQSSGMQRRQAVIHFMHATVRTFVCEDDGLAIVASDGEALPRNVRNANFAQDGRSLQNSQRAWIHHRLALACANTIRLDYRRYLFSEDRREVSVSGILSYAVCYGHQHAEMSLSLDSEPYDTISGILGFADIFKGSHNFRDGNKTIALRLMVDAQEPITTSDLEWFEKVYEESLRQEGVFPK